MTDPASTGGPSTLRKVGFATAATALLLLVLEGAASVFVAWRDMSPAPVSDGFANEQKNCEYDAELGWRLIPDLRLDPYRRPGTTFTTDARGIRGRTETTVAVPDGMTRVVCIGDSFTMGFGVGDHETFAHHMGALRPDVEALNLGVSGYGVDQIWLAYTRRGIELDADVVLCCVIEDDFRRMMFDRFGDHFAKPWIELVDDALVVRNVPVPEDARRSRFGLRLAEFTRRLGLGRLVPRPSVDDRWARSEAVAERLFADLAARCAERGRAFVLVLLPTFEEVSKGAAPKSRWLADVAREGGFPYLDLTPHFCALDPDDLGTYFRLKAGDRHYTGRGNRRVAKALLARLEELELLAPR